MEAGAALLLTTQASTKVYRTKRDGIAATQSLNATVDDGGLLVLAPDPVVPYEVPARPLPGTRPPPPASLPSPPVPVHASPVGGLRAAAALHALARRVARRGGLGGCGAREPRRAVGLQPLRLSQRGAAPIRPPLLAPALAQPSHTLAHPQTHFRTTPHDPRTNPRTNPRTPSHRRRTADALLSLALPPRGAPPARGGSGASQGGGGGRDASEWRRGAARPRPRPRGVRHRRERLVLGRGGGAGRRAAAHAQLRARAPAGRPEAGRAQGGARGGGVRAGGRRGARAARERGGWRRGRAGQRSTKGRRRQRRWGWRRRAGRGHRSSCGGARRRCARAGPAGRTASPFTRAARSRSVAGIPAASLRHGAARASARRLAVRPAHPRRRRRAVPDQGAPSPPLPPPLLCVPSPPSPRAQAGAAAAAAAAAPPPPTTEAARATSSLAAPLAPALSIARGLSIRAPGGNGWVPVQRAISAAAGLPPGAEAPPPPPLALSPRQRARMAHLSDATLPTGGFAHSGERAEGGAARPCRLCSPPSRLSPRRARGGVAARTARRRRRGGASLHARRDSLDRDAARPVRRRGVLALLVARRQGGPQPGARGGAVPTGGKRGGGAEGSRSVKA